MVIIPDNSLNFERLVFDGHINLSLWTDFEELDELRKLGDPKGLKAFGYPKERYMRKNKRFNKARGVANVSVSGQQAQIC
jgi:hypothetical protein